MDTISSTFFAIASFTSNAANTPAFSAEYFDFKPINITTKVKIVQCNFSHTSQQKFIYDTPGSPHLSNRGLTKGNQTFKEFAYAATPKEKQRTFGCHLINKKLG
ncbi:hypothetical protein HU763_018430 [Pseudomonas anuradhapurensis]|uniref:hypothetical protein n=1 Tax=Pseudomonas anuradhapurensis TaxID=485870 RepID=UPI0016489BEC|nr:hypothetical protein [Pseudomonas anuradhapurensis]QXI46728.1 hypothetical protein HU763_018430 [Pseudomonas anuradhapurensis]